MGAPGKDVLQLGVNTVRYGMPMIFRLQEDIQEVDAPLHKVRIGSLCHGYFWVLTDKFGLRGVGGGGGRFITRLFDAGARTSGSKVSISRLRCSNWWGRRGSRGRSRGCSSVKSSRKPCFLSMTASPSSSASP